MHSDDFIRCFKYDIENDLESHFDELFNRCTADDSEYCVVDGEEGDFGIIRYMLDGECIMVYFNHAGDDECRIITQYALDKYIRPLFNFEINVHCLIDSSIENCIAHFCDREYSKMLSSIGSVESIRNSEYLNDEQKNSILDQLEHLQKGMQNKKP